jgi:hypothetical protein
MTRTPLAVASIFIAAIYSTDINLASQNLKTGYGMLGSACVQLRAKRWTG